MSKKNSAAKKRRAMVVAVRRGGTLRSVAQEFGVSLHTVQRWVERALGQRLDRVDWSEELRGGRRETRATATEIEDLVLRLRRESCVRAVILASSARRQSIVSALSARLRVCPRCAPLAESCDAVVPWMGASASAVPPAKGVVQAARQRGAPRQEAAPLRRAFARVSPSEPQAERPPLI